MSTRRAPQRALGAEEPGAIQSWLRGDTLASLAELNEQCLDLLTEQARCAGSGAHPLLVELHDLWTAVEPAARVRAAGCPYLLLDAGFADARRWAAACGHSVHETAHTAPGGFFTVPQSAAVARHVFAYAWHLARSEPAAARLLLGLTPECAAIVAGCTLRQMLQLAEHNAGWLQPRWPGRVQAWRELLITAIAGESTELERARVRGLQLMAAELRAQAG